MAGKTGQGKNEDYMIRIKRFFQRATDLTHALAVGLVSAANAVETMTVEADVIGTTPVALV